MGTSSLVSTNNQEEENLDKAIEHAVLSSLAVVGHAAPQAAHAAAVPVGRGVKADAAVSAVRRSRFCLEDV